MRNMWGTVFGQRSKMSARESFAILFWVLCVLRFSLLDLLFVTQQSL